MSSWRCRKLKKYDLEAVARWRMMPHVTRYMNTDPALTIEGQKLWFARLNETGGLYYWIIEANGVPCGLINLSEVDTVNKRCLWGYYVAEKEYRCFELAVSLEMNLYDYCFDTLGLNKVISEAFCENAAVIKMHELCGCEAEGILKRHVLKNGVYYDICIQSMFSDKWLEIRKSIDYKKIPFDN